MKAPTRNHTRNITGRCTRRLKRTSFGFSCRSGLHVHHHLFVAIKTSTPTPRPHALKTLTCCCRWTSATVEKGRRFGYRH